MNRKALQTKLKFTLMIIVLGAVTVGLQLNLTQVKAQAFPVTVSTSHLSFGTAFPGETHEGEYTVYYNEQGEDVNYRLIMVRKPLGESHPEYPDGGDPLMPGYYRDLCPYLSQYSLEGESDDPSKALVGPTDVMDRWIVYLEVPAIMGQVAQDHEGGIVTSDGEYGCDISIDVLGEEPEEITQTSVTRSSLFTSHEGVNDETMVLGLDAAPDLRIEKHGPADPLIPGQREIEYTVIVSNMGEISAFGVVLEDTLPAGLYFSGTSETAKTFELGEVAPGEAITVKYDVYASDAIEPGIYTNIAVVSSLNNEDISAAADVSMEKPIVKGFESGELEPTGFVLNELLLLLFAAILLVLFSRYMRIFLCVDNSGTCNRKIHPRAESYK